METDDRQVDLVSGEHAVGLAGAALVAALTGALAHVVIPYPFSPTDVTLQVVAVFVAGLFLGARWGAASMGLYAVAGALGAPVFKAGASSVGYLLGPTGGYVIGFVAAAFVVGAVAHGHYGPADPSSVGTVRLIAALAAGTVVIYAIGTPWLAYASDMGLIEAAVVGGAVFVPADALKAAAVLGLVRSDRRPRWPPARVTERR